jgi:hypothetical protein
MEYIATKRCPLCRSEKTTVSIVPSSVNRGKDPFTVVSEWTCQSCHHTFTDPAEHESHPVLMCEACRVPTRHDYVGTVDAVWRDPNVKPATSAAPTKLESYRCPCGRERSFGIASHSSGLAPAA